MSEDLPVDKQKGRKNNKRTAAERKAQSGGGLSAGQKRQAESRHDTADLDYISTWDAICYDPTDAFMHGPEVMFDDGSFDVGESYPRGV